MKAFDYAAPTTLDEAIRLLSGSNGDARPLAGGTDLIAQMKEGRKRPSLVVDVKRIPELQVLAFDEADGLRIGAAVPCTDVAGYDPVRRRFPAIAYAASLVGSIQIQNRASVGGNLCNAAPSADVAPPLICHKARAIVAGPGGRRELPLEDFFVGPGKIVLGKGELLVEVRLPVSPPGSACAYLRFIPREEMDIAVAGVGSWVELGRDRKVREARITLAAVAPTPLRAGPAEESLVGKLLDETSLAEAGRLAAAAARPIDDVRGTAAYRRELVNVLTRRTLRQCGELLGVN